MNIERINSKARDLKIYIIQLLSEVVENDQFRYLQSSKSEISGYYKVHKNDVPIFRDLKAFLNMITAVERATAKITTKYALFGASVADKINILDDVLEFRRGFKIYLSTSSIISSYLRFAKDYTITNLVPKIIVKLKELSDLCTKENFNTAADFFIENVTVFENYQENYIKQKQQLKDIEFGATIEEKDEIKREDFLTVLVTKNDYYLQKFYAKEYDKIFARDEVEGQPLFLQYYPEAKKDNGVVKNIKLLLNSIIGIKNALDSHGKYQNSKMIESLSYIQALYSDLVKIYSSITGFDYQAIIAEKSTPYTDELKKQIGKLNPIFEKLACYADQFELRMRLKPGTILHNLDKVVNYYNEITSELRIKTDYLIQKDSFYTARMKFRKETIKDMDFQIKQLKRFRDFEYTSLPEIPYIIILDMQKYIKTYYNEISMDRRNLLKYTQELARVLLAERGFFPFIKARYNNVINYMGLTVHSELMSSLSCRLQFLINQRDYILQKNTKLDFKHHLSPYKFLSFSDDKHNSKNKAVEKLLEQRLSELQKEESTLATNPALLFVPNLEVKEHKINEEDLGDSKEEKIEPKAQRQTERQQNKIQQKLLEYGIFKSILSNYRQNHEIGAAEIINSEVNLSPRSVHMLDEIERFIKVSRV